MKLHLALMLGSLCCAPAALACGDNPMCNPGADACSPAQQEACVKHLNLSLPGLTSKADATKLASGLKGVKGVEDVHINLKGRRAVVDYCGMHIQDPKVILSAVTKAGFKAQVAATKTTPAVQ